MSRRVHIAGAGLAGAEAAWQVVQMGCEAVIHEMRPSVTSPAHRTGNFAELVCSNSFKSKVMPSASALLKEELSRLGSLIMSCAMGYEVPAGQALAVDRNGFSSCITQILSRHHRVTVIEEEVTAIPEPNGEPWIIASGPLTSDPLAEALKAYTGEEYLHFFDAVAPIVTMESLDLDKVFKASRYDKGDADYLNCPLDASEYYHFVEELLQAECHPLRDFETTGFFEGCIPVEEMARRGAETLAFGPLKPVGLNDPRSGTRPHAVVQLRRDNVGGSLYNMVGFQTNLRHGEQDRVFRLIPGLSKADFVRYGMMHRNLFINSPKLLKESLQFACRDDLFAAGQITGVEGYIESAASGWLAGQNAARLVLGKEMIILPAETMMGALVYYITHAESKFFQPMNAVFGIMPPLDELPMKESKKQRHERLVKRSLDSLGQWMKKV